MIYLYLLELLNGSTSSLLLHDVDKVLDSLHRVMDVAVKLICQVRKLCRTANHWLRLGLIQPKLTDDAPVSTAELFQDGVCIIQVERDVHDPKHDGQVQRDVPEELCTTLPADP